MKVEQVKKKNVFHRWLYWIKEREWIRVQRAEGQSAPWTYDEILGNYRFCNVRRMDDKVSQWLLNNWYMPYFNHKDMLAAVTLARFFNKPETLAAITPFVFDKEQVDWIAIESCVKELRKSGAVFNGAYMVRGNSKKTKDKVEIVLHEYTRPMLESIKDFGRLPTGTMENAHAMIADSYGFGSFMAGQIVADLRWAMEGRWGDRNSWAPIGPGSNRGMNRILQRDLKHQAKQIDFVNELRGLIVRARDELSMDFVDRLEAIDWQNTLCEFDKYERALHGEGRPKSTYKPGASK